MINCTFTFSCPCCSLTQALVMHDGVKNVRSERKDGVFILGINRLAVGTVASPVDENIHKESVNILTFLV